MTDFLLKIRYPRDRADIGEQIDALLYAIGTGGSSSITEGEREVVTTVFPDEASRAAAADAFAAIDDCTVEAVDARTIDWLAQYQQSLVALEIGKRFVVAPDESLVGSSDRLKIVIP